MPRAKRSPWAGNGGVREGSGPKPRYGVPKSAVLRYQATPTQLEEIQTEVDASGRPHNQIALEQMLAWARAHRMQRGGAT